MAEATTAQGSTESGAKTETKTETTPTTPAPGSKTETPAAGATPTAEGKTGESTTPTQDTKSDEGKGKTDAQQPVGAPATYALTVPDGGATFFDADDLKSFETQARKENLTNADAQALINEHIEQTRLASESFLSTLKADTDYGGDKLAETQRLARVGIDLIRPEGHTRRDSFTRWLNKIGGSNHIEAVSFLADLGKRASEDPTGFTASAARRSGAVPPEEKLYDHPTSKR